MQIHEHYDKWLGYALKFTGNNTDLAYDLVQEMYLKCHDIETVNCSYIYLTIKTLYLDHLKKEKRYNGTENEINETVEQKDFQIVEEVKKALDKIPFAIKECLIESQDYSYRQLQERYNINYNTIRRMVLNAEVRLKYNKVLKEYYGTEKKRAS